jgi:3-phenylpropionate/trans-cinnamate dioxygenase ferredoxin subunit
VADWKSVATVDEFTADDRKYVEVADQEIAIFKDGAGNLRAVSPWCTHQRVSLMSGWIEGGELVCPLHGARFDLATGRHLCAPAPRPLLSYPLKIEDGQVWVDVSVG